MSKIEIHETLNEINHSIYALLTFYEVIKLF